jgi:hypothetical protein
MRKMGAITLYVDTLNIQQVDYWILAQVDYWILAQLVTILTNTFKNQNLIFFCHRFFSIIERETTTNIN